MLLFKQGASRPQRPQFDLLRRRIALQPPRPLDPLALAHARLEVRRDGGEVLAGRGHGAAHLVAVRINCGLNSVRPENTRLWLQLMR